MKIGKLKLDNQGTGVVETLLLLVVVAVVVGAGAYVLGKGHAAPASKSGGGNTSGGGSSISIVPSTASDNLYHYGNTVTFNWQTNYKNTNVNQYYSVRIEVICYQNGKQAWWADSSSPDITGLVSPTPPLTLGSNGNGYNSPGPGGWYYSNIFWNSAAPTSCTATLFHFGNNAKFMTLATTAFNAN